ncbi:MAG: hypothetical protein M1833_007122 [Piccolia ochrophora]|nr:MAG: hypothetical protein M1833_007122 [Piccolia ochrophora]
MSSGDSGVLVPGVSDDPSSTGSTPDTSMVVDPPPTVDTGKQAELDETEDIDVPLDNGIWDIVEEEVPDEGGPGRTKAPKTDATTDPSKRPKKSLYLWKSLLAADAFKPEPRPSSLWVPFDPAGFTTSGGKRNADALSDMSFVRLSAFLWWRQLSDDKVYRKWGTNDRNVEAKDKDAADTSINVGQVASGGQTTTIANMDQMFAQAQEWAASIDPAKYPAWVRRGNLRWKKLDRGGHYTQENDTREFQQRTDGFAFIPRAETIGEEPSLDALYVKLLDTPINKTNGEAYNLTIYDPQSWSRGVSTSAMYIDRPTMEVLRTPKVKNSEDDRSSYDWEKTKGFVFVRNKQGELSRLWVSDKPNTGNMRTFTFWQKAWTHGVVKQEAKAVRSRNPNNLDLLFVVPTNSRVTVEQLKALVEKVKKAAVIKINQNVQIVGETAENAVEIKKIYDYRLGVSPFNDYETWVKTKDYIAYLRSYPGYTLPSDEASIQEAFAALRVGETAKANNEAYKEKLKRQEEKAAQHPNSGAGVKVDFVSIKTVQAAGVRGARAGAPDQGDQIGGSASLVRLYGSLHRTSLTILLDQIAKSLRWKAPQERVGRPEPQYGDVKWDSPGVYPAEWLHRSAFSWGNPAGNDVSQISSNFIFGSSEANSIMTRYEKSWQRLFTKERSIQNARNRNLLMQNQFAKPSFPPFEGILTTINTSDKDPILEVQVEGEKVTPVKHQATDTGIPEYWKWAVNYPNICFSLRYSLLLGEGSQSSLGQTFGPLTTFFYPFQRGFFTRIEADVDYALLDKWATDAIAKLSTTSTPAVSGSNTIRSAATTIKKANTPSITLNPMGAALVDGSSVKPVTLASPSLVSSNPPSARQHAAIWRDILQKKPVKVGEVQISDPSVVTMTDDGRLSKVPLATGVGSKGPVKAFVARKPLTTAHLAVHGAEAPSETTTIDAPPELKSLGDDAIVPKGFILSGTVKLFGKFDAHMYSYHGTASNGLRQIVTVAPGTVGISDYIPSLAGSPLEAVQLQNTQFVYNQFTTATDQAGTWLKTDVLFSGPLQLISDVFKDVFNQEKPALTVEGLLSATNDWANPVNPMAFGLRGSLHGISVKFADLIEFTDIGLSLSIGSRKGMYPPYAKTYDWGVGFFGSLRLVTPKDMMTMSLRYSLSEYAGIMTILLSAAGDDDTPTDFCGVPGLQLSDIRFSASFPLGSAPSQLALSAGASLRLRDTTLDLDGYYSKDDWGFSCELKNFDLYSLHDLYEDLFSSPLHLSDHEVVFDDLVLIAGSSGFTLSGRVTIEGHSSAQATIAISRLGVHITGAVSDIELAGDVVLKQASLDVFIGRTDDTALSGPGTSFRFAIAGIVSVASNDILASLYIDKEPSGNVIWTVVGGFTGAFAISHIAPALKGTFLDLSLRQATFIASNVDGQAAAGVLIPAGYTVVKGVQIAASLDSINALDSTLDNKGAPTAGLVLKAIYSATDSAFKLVVQLPAPKTVSMKNSNVWSGPISLAITVSMTPTLVLSADFFVRVPNQTDPLKFTGGLSMSSTEAALFIELKDQWWTNPFGLSPQLKLGPNLALQIGIVYVGLVYPSEIGIAAGLAVGKTSGSAALLISETPTDQLIMMEINDLGVTDLVDFASTIFETSLSTPSDFLRFKQLKFYLSTGTTIGTIVYPAGASFSCDAIIFGTEASIYCAVDKAQKKIKVQGSLSEIDVGPVTVSGAKPGTKAVLDVQLGGPSEIIVISGSLRILDLYAMVDVNASLGLAPNFDLKAELDFSTNLTFLLQASMKGGTFKSLSGLKSLEFDIHAAFHQDILDYIAVQVNTQILAAKHAVDDGIDAAQATLLKAQENFDRDLSSAQTKVDAAKATYEAKMAEVTGALAAEQTATQLRITQLTAEVGAVNVAYRKAVDNAKQDLQRAQENRTIAIRNDQQKVNDAQTEGDRNINNHLRDLADARNDMQNRFGNAIDNLNNAQNDVNRQQAYVEHRQRALVDAIFELNKIDGFWHPIDKAIKGTQVAALGTEVTALQAGLNIATATLNACKAIVSGPGYSAASASVSFYEGEVETARATADGTLQLANATLQGTINVQDGVVQQAQNALDLVSDAGTELHLIQLALAALQTFQAASERTLAGLQSAVDALGQSAEFVAFSAANEALAIARANVKDLDIARSAMETARQGTDAILDMGSWMVSNAVNILNVTSVEVTGDLRGLAQEGSKLSARVVGTFAGENVDFSCEFLPAQGEEFVKRVFTQLLDDAKAGILKIAG